MGMLCGERKEHYVGRRAMGMEVQGRRKRGRLRRRQCEEGLYQRKGTIDSYRGRKCLTELNGDVNHQTTTPHKSGTNMKTNNIFFFCKDTIISSSVVVFLLFLKIILYNCYYN